MPLENIHSVLGIGNCYIVERDEYSVLIDAGYHSDFKRIIKTLEVIASTKPPKYIIITHAHPDHMSTIEKIRAMYTIEVVSHENEKEYAEGKKFPKPKTLLARGFACISNILPTIRCSIDHTLANGDIFEGFRIYHTPGHTPGSIILEDPDSRAIFTGDTILTNKKGTKIKKPSPVFSIDYDSALSNAVRVLSSTRPQFIFPGHGKPIINAKKAVNAFLTKFKVT